MSASPRTADARAPRWERKAEERPAALLEAALDAFARHGYHATRLETVARAAGVSKGTVYTYFRNKDDLLRKALEHRLKRKYDLVEAELGNFRGSSEEKLRLFLERAWTRALSPDWGRVHKLMHGEIAESAPELYRFWIRHGLRNAWSMLADLIDAGRRTGEFRADADPEGTARFLLSGLTSQAFLQIHMGVGKLDRVPVQRIFAAGVDGILRGLRSGPAAPVRPEPPTPGKRAGTGGRRAAGLGAGAASRPRRIRGSRKAAERNTAPGKRNPA